MVQALVFLLLVLDVLPYRRLVTTHGRDEVPSGPKILSYEIALPLSVRPRQVDRGLLPLMKPTTCETAYFGGIEIIM